MTVGPELLTPAEAAAILGITPKYLSTVAGRYRLRVVRTPGRHRRYVAVDVYALRDSRNSREVSR